MSDNETPRLAKTQRQSRIHSKEDRLHRRLNQTKFLIMYNYIKFKRVLFLMPEIISSEEELCNQ